jgi:hypothetical protein
MSKIVDKSCIEFDRKKFEAELAMRSEIIFSKQIEAKTQELINQINEYKVKFENRIVSGRDIARKLKCCGKFVYQHIRNNKWQCIPSIKYKTSNARTKQSSVVSDEKKIRLLLEKYQNFRVGDLIYTIEGLPVIFTGMVNGKLSKKNTLYTKNTYKHAEIQNIEESCGIKSKAFKSNDYGKKS